MAVLAIAGSGRGAGKTAVGCALLAAMPELRWLAVKVSPHRHEPDQELWEELDRRSEKDTGRYLAAGARRAFLVTGAADGRLAELIFEARGRAPECDAVLVESNRVHADTVAKPGEGAVAIAVVSGAEVGWKPSLRECLGRMDALAIAGAVSVESLGLEFGRKPVFALAAGEWLTPELVGFVRRRLLAER